MFEFSTLDYLLVLLQQNNGLKIYALVEAIFINGMGSNVQLCSSSRLLHRAKSPD